MSANPVRITPRLIVGLGVLAVGLLWTLDNLDIVETDAILEWWPMILILVGVVRLLDPHANKFGSFAFIIIGGGLLLDSLDFMNFDIGDLIPVGIVILGGKLVLDALGRRPEPPRTIDERDAIVHAFALMAGVRRQTTSTEFRGGDANAIMGGVELDLRGAHIKEGEQAVLDAFAFWGGIEIRVPETWRVVGNVLPLMGAFEDNTSNKSGAGPILVVRGTAIMGGIEVKN